MTTRGKKPKPTHLKVLAGTDRPDRKASDNVPEFDGIDSFPEPPQHLSIDGAEMWKNLGRQLVKSGVLQAVDLYALEQLCVAWHHHRMRAKAGLSSTAADNTALRTLFAEFGMTPASRMRVGADPKKTGNKFGNNGKRNHD